MKIFGKVPYLVIPFVLYHILIPVASRQDAQFNSAIFPIPLISGAKMDFTWGTLILLLGVIALGLEVVKSARQGARQRNNSSWDQFLSLGLFVVCLLEFMLVGPAGTSTFFLFMLLTLVDGIVGPMISVEVARRDFGAMPFGGGE